MSDRGKRAISASGATSNGGEVLVQPKRARIEQPEAGINSCYASQELLERLTACWKAGRMLQDEYAGAMLLDTPFQCCLLPNFIEEDSPAADRHFLQGLRDELLRLKFYEKKNDLYQFQQSDDLKKFKTPYITSLRSVLHSKCLPMLRSVTGIALTDTIDMTCSKYQYTDVLLCHDDQLEGRRIAFIYYLVPEWSKEDGGALDLFECDECGQPRSVVKSLLPKWNNFVFFDVNALSFHQVAEVLTPDKTRLSINGWFHGPPAARPTPYVESPPSLISPTPSGLDVLSDWINPFYLDVGVQSRVQEQFEADSQIELPGFLLEEKYSSICEEMENCQISWTVKGPPNKRCVRTSARTALPPIAKACLDFLHSGPICLLLAHLTGLELAQNIIKPVLEQDEGDPQEGGSSLGRGEGSGGEGEEVEDGQSDEGDINEGEGGDNDRNGSRTGEEEEDEGEAGREGTAPLREEAQGQGDIQPVAEQAKELVHSCTEVASSRPCEDSSTSQPTDNSPEVVPVPPGTPVARCRGDLYRWQAGSYTLANDSDPLLATGEYALDLMLSFGCHGWSAEFGGVTSYIAKDEDEELLSISPTPNALSLVYRDLDSLRFTSYVNHRAGSSSFYTIAMEYYEGPGPGEGRD